MLYYIEFAIFESNNDSDTLCAIRREDQHGEYFAVYFYFIEHQMIYEYAHDGDLSYTRF